jgi:DNA polymerase eta
VFEAIKHFVTELDPNIIVEKASVDEAFIDLTQHINQLMERSEPVPDLSVLTDTYLELNETNDLKQWLTDLKENEILFGDEIRLALGSVVVQQIRKEILDKTQFKCSAGISHNKMLSKLCCAIHKPNAQTILPQSGVEQLFRKTDIKKVRSLGGKLGNQIKTAFKINTMFELKSLEFKDLTKIFDPKTAKWLRGVAEGLDDDPVSNRQISKSLGCGKNFPGIQRFLHFIYYFH